MPVTLELIPGEFTVARLSATAPVPDWSASLIFSAIVRTGDELSITCPATQVPPEVKQERDWRLLKFCGPFAFTETGVLASVLQPLAAANIGILATSTFDTDYLLVKSAHLPRVISALGAAGHTVCR